MPAIAPFRALRPAQATAASTWAIGLPGPSQAQLASWVREGRLVRDRTPALYRYEVTWGAPEERRRTAGLLARLALEEPVDALAVGAADAPVPLTPYAPVTQALPAAHATPGPTSPLPGVDSELVVFRHEDPRGWVDEVLQSNAFDEVARCTDPSGGEHRVWRVDRPEGVGEVVAQFEDRSLRVEQGDDTLGRAQERWRQSRSEADGAVLALFVAEGADAAPWRCGLVMAPRDESRPKPWQELAGDPGPARWRTPSLG